jgi:hypothetical protein
MSISRINLISQAKSPGVVSSFNDSTRLGVVSKLFPYPVLKVKYIVFFGNSDLEVLQGPVIEVGGNCLTS